MENATKALLIAAAILIAIVLVSIGVFVLRQGQDAMSSADMSEAQILAFNANFEPYKGIQRGSQVSALLTRIKNNNAKNENLIKGDSGSLFVNASGAVDTANLQTAGYYQVVFTPNAQTGLIDKVKITQTNAQ